MKAAILTGYNKKGKALEIREVPVPTPGVNDVLIKISTAGVNLYLFTRTETGWSASQKFSGNVISKRPSIPYFPWTM